MEKLQVPENITLRWEAWRGVGKAELAAILAVTALAAVAGIIFCWVSPMESDRLIAMFIVVTSLAFAAGFFTKMDNNQSIYDFFRRQSRFHREQQSFQWRGEKRKEVYLFAEAKTERG